MKTKFWKMASVLVLGIAMAVSCDDPVKPEVPKEDPNFPEKLTKTLGQGETCEISIAPNYDWEVAISGDTDYFELRFNDEPVPVASGRAGEYTLTVAAKEAEDFEQRQVELTMKMEGKEEVIAEIHRNGKDRIFNVYAAKVKDGKFVYGDDGYEFEEAGGTEFSLMHIGDGTIQTFIKVNANFDWRLKEVPEWATVNIGTYLPYVDASEANVPGVISLVGNNPAYPLGGAEGRLVFVVDDGSANPVEVEKEITLALPKVEDIFEVAMPAGGKFNKEGQFFDEMNGEYGDRPLTGSAVGVDGVCVLAYDSTNNFEWAGSSTENKPDEYSNWVNITLTPENEEDVLRSYDVRITVKPNDRGVGRSADIFVIPASVVISDPKWDILNDNYDGYKEEYRQYKVATITQEAETGGSEDDLIIGDSNVLAGQGATFEHLSASTEWIAVTEEVFGVGAGNYYHLTVSKLAGIYNLKLNFEMWNAVAYELNDYGQIAESTTLWCEPSQSNLSLDLPEGTTVENMRFIVYQGENNANVACVLVTYDPEANPGGGDILSFMMPEYVSGCKLRKMTVAEDAENELFLACAEMFWGTEDYPIYELTYGPNRNMPMLTSTLAFDAAFLMNDADASWLSFEGSQEMLSINMFDYESETGFPTEYRAGAIMFNDNSQGYPMPRFAVVCVFDPDFTGGNGGGAGDSITADNGVLAESGASFIKMVDDMNFAEFVETLDAAFAVGSDNYYVLNVTNPEGVYSGFTYAEQPVMFSCLEMSDDVGLVESESYWAGMTENGDIVVNLTENDMYQFKFLVLKSWSDAIDDAVNMAVILVWYAPEDF